MNFNKYFPIDVQIEKINKGITNYNYLTSNGYVIKKYSNLVKNNEVKVVDLVKDFDVPLKIINKEVKITKYFSDALTLEDDGVNVEKIISIAGVIKKLHNQDIKSEVYFDPRDIIKDYLSKIKKPFYEYEKYFFLIKKIEEKYPTKKELVFCHNDLTPGNFLFTKNKLYLIDWEYAGMNDKYFDVVSFLNENNLYNTKYKEIFIKEYFGDEYIDWARIELWNNFQNLMWCIWSNMMYESRPEKIYLEICDYKIKNLESVL